MDGMSCQKEYPRPESAMRHRLKATCLLPLVLGGVAVAQDLPVDIPESPTDASSIASAAQALSNAGVDKLLVKDLLGKTLEGADGNAVGTVENFVVVPGGRVVAALISTGDDTMIAMPYAAIKVAGAADSSRLHVPLPASEIRGMSELQSLARSITN